MIEFGDLVEEITQVLGPVKRKSVFEEWHDARLQVTATVPVSSHLVVRGEPGRRVICSLASRRRGNVDLIDKDGRTAW